MMYSAMDCIYYMCDAIMYEERNMKGSWQMDVVLHG